MKTVALLPRTEAFLAANPEVWDDGYIAFHAGANDGASLGKEAIVSFFEGRASFPSKSGLGEHQLLIKESALREISVEDGRRALIQLLKDELHMFSIHKVAPAVLEELAGVFFSEMEGRRVYSNRLINPADEAGSCLGPWTAITTHTRDTLVCAVNNCCVAFWLYSDDE
jgi:hypothetical protein